MMKILPTAISSFAMWSLITYFGASCSGLVIDLNFDASMQDRAEVQAGVQRAANMWESVLADPVTLQFDIRVAPVWETGLNIAMTYMTSYRCTLPEIRGALTSDAVSVDDLTAVSHLPVG